jgi:predicted anti-sigma-YlaC factor YlaD
VVIKVNEMDDKKCQSVRELVSEALDGAAATGKNASLDGLVFEEESVAAHMESCSPCRSWHLKTEDIMELARSLPQFDVPEQLTQSILSEVCKEESARQQLSWVVYVVALAAFLFMIIFMDAYESIWGIGSWLVGFATMLALKLLVSEPVEGEQETA